MSSPIFTRQAYWWELLSASDGQSEARPDTADYRARAIIEDIYNISIFIKKTLSAF